MSIFIKLTIKLTSIFLSVTDYAHTIQRAMRRLPNVHMQFFHPDHELTRTQDLKKDTKTLGSFIGEKPVLGGRKCILQVSV